MLHEKTKSKSLSQEEIDVSRAQNVLSEHFQLLVAHPSASDLFCKVLDLYSHKVQLPCQL